MKLLKTLFLTALMLCLTATAFAGNTRPGIENEMPAEIQDFFSSESRQDNIIMDYVVIENYCFVATRSGERTNTLFGFKQTDEGWKYWLKNADAMPQGGHRILLGNAQGTNRLVDDYVYKLPTLSIAIIQEEEDDFCAHGLTYELRSGVWTLEDMSSNDKEEYHVTLGDNRLTYYDEYEAVRAKGTVRGTVQRNLRYISVSAIPTNYYDAKDKLTVAPQLPASAELKAQEIKFTGNRKYDVYSAPTSASYRGANGKAVVSTNSWIQVFGVEDGWAMIQYSIDADHYRIGYITEDALPAKADVGELAFSPTPALTTFYTTYMTDDPFYSKQQILRLEPFAEVTLLGTIGSWAYIEVESPQLTRGFVPADTVFTDRESLHQAMTTPVPGADK